MYITSILLVSLKSFGVPYMSPYFPISNMSGDNNYILPPIFKREKRPDFLNTKRANAQNKISQKWKFDGDESKNDSK